MPETNVIYYSLMVIFTVKYFYDEIAALNCCQYSK